MISTHTQYKIMSVLYKFPKLFNIVRWVYHFCLKKMVESKRNKQFRKNALYVLESFHKCMEENNLYYTLAFGSLLGAIREKGFIKHDMDIDVVMWNDDYRDIIKTSLLSSGFKLSHRFLVNNGEIGREETYVLNGVGIDIFYIHEYCNKTYCCDFITLDDSPTFQISMKNYGYVVPRRIELPFKRGRKLVKFENIKLYVPNNAIELLECRYGMDYMTPKRKWGIKSYDKYITIWSEQKAIFEDFE